MSFSIEAEVIALIILLVICLFHYDRQNTRSIKYRWFNACLIVSAIAIVSDLFTCLMLADISAYPIWLHMLANSIYFIAINSSMSLISAYIFFLMFAHMREQKCYRIALAMILLMYALMIALVLVNVWTGCYFYFADNEYRRGPLNKLSFLVILIEVIMLCCCYYRNRKLVTPYAGHLMRTLPPLILVMLVLQTWVPDVIFTGTIAAIVNLIIFACFQNNRIERDALTELSNRPSFFRELNYHKKKGSTGHIILIHLCQLDKLNKRFGMKTGDSFIYNVARYLENLQVDYQVYRYGNTHFLVCGEFQGVDVTEKLVEEIYDRFRQPWNVQGEQWMQQIQLIHMYLPAEEMDENILTDRLNYLLAYSKDKNVSTKLFFNEELKAQYERKMYVLNEVKRAIKSESFRLNFQPIYDCTREKFLTAEVLLRLYTEDGSIISPGEFIPIAEENGLTDDISWFVLKNSMDFIIRHPEMPLEAISINMSINQMRKPFLDEKLKGLEELYISLLGKLRLEITENTIAQNPELVTRVMKVLVESGLNFYLDDFGMGYSNFSRVFGLPFEVVKIDRSLMQNIDRDEKACSILKNLVEMLHNADFKVIAEGVERETQVEKVKSMGVECIQGYYYARPMEESALLEFLSNCENERM